MNIERLRELFAEYIESIEDDEYEEEYFMTMREFAKWQVEPFLNWLEERERNDK